MMLGPEPSLALTAPLPVPPILSRLSLAQDTLALVLAGGRGSRLRHLAAHRAKPAAPFGGKFRIIDFTLSNCINSGVRRIGVLLQYESHSLIRHLQQGWNVCRGEFGECLELLPAEQRQRDDQWYAGTADAVQQNIDFIRAQGCRRVLVLAGDHVYRMDYLAMLLEHDASGAELSIGCVERPLAEASQLGVLQVDGEGCVTGFAEKPARPGPMADDAGQVLASMGVYVFDTEYLIRALQRDAADPHSDHDFGRNVIPDCLARGGHVRAHRFHDPRTRARGYWRDVGHLDAYWQANLELTDSQPPFDLYDVAWPVRTHQPQVPPARFSGGGAGGAIDTLVSDGCVVSDARLRRSVLFVRACVGAGSQIEESLLLPRVSVGRDCRLRRVIVEEGCVLPDGMVVGENREHDAQRFHVTDGGVVVVTPAMLRGARGA